MTVNINRDILERVDNKQYH